MITLRSNIPEFEADLARYIALSRKTPAEAIAKQGTKFGFEFAKRLKATTPPRGSIRSAGLAILAAGRGIRVRAGLADRVARRIYNRAVPGRRQRLNVRAVAVRAELGLRERGRGFLAFAGGFRALRQIAGAPATAARSVRQRGRYRQVIASANLRPGFQDAALTLTYGSDRSAVGAALARHQPEAQAALRAVWEDMLVYIRRKLQTAWGRANMGGLA